MAQFVRHALVGLSALQPSLLSHLNSLVRLILPYSSMFYGLSHGAAKLKNGRGDGE